MRRRGLLGALALLLLVNAAVLGGVAWNRFGPPDASVRLTERELPVQLRRYGLREDSGVALALKVNRADAALDWLNEAKLRELGFRPEDFGRQDDVAGWEARRQALPRDAYLVLEFDGPAWQAALAERERRIEDLAAGLARDEATVEQLQRARESLQDMRRGGSRLMPVDAGTDAGTLRQRYADRSRYLIVAAEVGMWVYRSPGAETDGPPVQGRIQQLLPDQIHVPLPHRAALQASLGEELQDGQRTYPHAAHPPRYQVALSYGARHEPWISEITPLQPSED